MIIKHQSEVKASNSNEVFLNEMHALAKQAFGNAKPEWAEISESVATEARSNAPELVKRMQAGDTEAAMLIYGLSRLGYTRIEIEDGKLTNVKDVSGGGGLIDKHLNEAVWVASKAGVHEALSELDSRIQHFSMYESYFAKKSIGREAVAAALIKGFTDLVEQGSATAAGALSNLYLQGSPISKPDIRLALQYNYLHRFGNGDTEINSHALKLEEMLSADEVARARRDALDVVDKIVNANASPFAR